MSWPLALILAVTIIAIAWIAVTLIQLRTVRKTTRDISRDFRSRWDR